MLAQADQNLHRAYFGQQRIKFLHVDNENSDQTARMVAHVRRYVFAQCGLNILIPVGHILYFFF